MVRQDERKAAAWPRRTVAVALALLALFFLLPLLMLPEEAPRAKETEPPLPTATLPVVTAPPKTAAAPVPGWDDAQTVRLLRSDGTVEKLTMAQYLRGVVSAETPASFHIEALKAQAVCARTYCVHQMKNAPDKHLQADVCADFACCQAYMTDAQAAQSWGEEAQRWGDKIAQAVSDTDGLLCLYDGEPIDAVFFSSSAGKTSDAAEVWGKAVPYLVSVDSPEGEEVPGWQTVVTFTPAEFTARFTASCPQADFSGDPARWFGDLETDSSGAVKSVTVGGVKVTGGQIRNILGLRSTHFTAAASEKDVTFWVTGYGHGVGLSQYGANALAGEGRTFQEILEWYYTGVTVAGLG